MNTLLLDAEDFICEVRKYPEIWDPNSDQYRYPSKRQRAWAEIASTFIDQFNDLPNSEKIIIYKKLQDKWRNIRDAYVKSKRINSKKNYMYAEHLEFLNDIYKPVSEGEEHASEDQTKIKLIKKEKSHFEESNDCWQSDNADSNLELEPPKKKKKHRTESIEFVDSFPDVACGTMFSEEDEDRSFFNSLLPAVRQFSTDQKLEFRSEVITLVKKIRANVV